MIAFQMAGKATRDALFLSTFGITALPTMIIVAAFLSLGLAAMASRAMTRWGPARLVVGTFVVSGMMLLVEWSLVGTWRRPVAAVLYIHFTGLGALLVSGFWSIVNERFDPRTAKRQVGRITAGGTIGALLGGALAAAIQAVGTMLPVLALLHFASAVLVSRIPDRGVGPAPRTKQSSSSTSPLRILAATPYLRTLVILVALGTLSEGFIDFVFKARADAVFDGDAALLRFFAIFYTGTSLVTMMIQTTATRRILERIGLARSVATLPAAVVLGGSGALLFPSLGGVLVARGAESITRNSVYRSAYELLFGPVAPRDKRATKAVIDVGVARLGDAAGGGIIQAILLAASRQAWTIILVLGVILSAAALWIARRLQRGYLRTLERSLLAQADHLDLHDVDGMTTTTMLHTMGGIDLTQFRTALSGEQLGPAPPQVDEQEVGRPGLAVAGLGPELARAHELSSRDAGRVRHALSAEPLTPTQVAFVIPLLAWDPVAREAIAALRSVAGRVVGQLVDAMVDQDQPFAVRRRIPVVLGSCPSQRAAEGLIQALSDQRFEVRYRAGRVLSRIRTLDASLHIDRDRILSAVDREMQVDHGVWEGRRILDQLEDEDWSPVLDEVLRERADRSLEHVFTMLSLVYPPQPLKVAFQGIHTDDAILRGTALEYLETALPTAMWTKLQPFIEDSRPTAHSVRESREVLADLLNSQHSIVIQLESLKRLTTKPKPDKPSD
jgi:hypothetical protein